MIARPSVAWSNAFDRTLDKLVPWAVFTGNIFLGRVLQFFQGYVANHPEVNRVAPVLLKHLSQFGNYSRSIQERHGGGGE